MLRPGQIVSCETGKLSPLYIGLKYHPKVLTSLLDNVIHFSYNQELRLRFIDRIQDKQLKTYVKDFVELREDFDKVLQTRRKKKNQRQNGKELLSEIVGFADQEKRQVADFTLTMLCVKRITEELKNRWGKEGFREPRAFRPIPIAYYHVLGKNRSVQGILRTESEGEYGGHSYRYFERIQPEEPFYIIAPAQIMNTIESAQDNKKARYEEQWQLRTRKHAKRNQHMSILLRLAKESNYSWEQGWLDFQEATLSDGTFLVTESQVRVKQ